MLPGLLSCVVGKLLVQETESSSSNTLPRKLNIDVKASLEFVHHRHRILHILLIVGTNRLGEILKKKDNNKIGGMKATCIREVKI